MSSRRGSTTDAPERRQKLRESDSEPADREAEGQVQPKRSKATFDLPADLLTELRVASVTVPLRAIGGSLSGLAEKALRRELEELRDRFNDGEPFEPEEGEEPRARRGRPPRA